MTSPQDKARALAQIILQKGAQISAEEGRSRRMLDFMEQAIAAALTEYGEECRAAKECSHCSGVIQSYQMKYHRGCLCLCHEGTYAEADAEGYRRGKDETLEAMQGEPEEYWEMKGYRRGRSEADELFVLEVDCELGAGCRKHRTCSGASHWLTFEQIRRFHDNSR